MLIMCLVLHMGKKHLNLAIKVKTRSFGSTEFMGDLTYHKQNSEIGQFMLFGLLIRREGGLAP